MTKHYHALPKSLFADHQISQDRLQKHPHETDKPDALDAGLYLREQQIGKLQEQSVIGTLTHTDDPILNTEKFATRWPQIEPFHQLILPDTQGGLLLHPGILQYSQSQRPYYEHNLLTRALNKGKIEQLLPDCSSTNHNPFPPAPIPPSTLIKER